MAWSPRPARVSLSLRAGFARYDAHVPGQPIATMTGEHVIAVVEHLLALSSNDYTRTSTTRMFAHFSAPAGAISTPRILPASFRVLLAYRLAHLPPRLPWDDVRRAIDAISTATPTAVRNRAIPLLLATTGLRNKELRSLELRDIHGVRAECSAASNQGEARSRRAALTGRRRGACRVCPACQT